MRCSARPVEFVVQFDGSIPVYKSISRRKSSMSASGYRSEAAGDYLKIFENFISFIRANDIISPEIK